MVESKRKRCVEVVEGDDEIQPRHKKRVKTVGRNHYDDLSNELVLRILSFLPVYELTKAEQVCKRFHRLAADNTIWRQNFYQKFVFPRMRRLPGLAGLDAKERDKAALQHAYKRTKWLEKFEKYKFKMDWKHRFKVKLNWSEGRCTSHEVPLNYPAQPRILVRVHNGIIITASECGLQLYPQNIRPRLLTSYNWTNGLRHPTAMAVFGNTDDLHVVIGFDGGYIEAYKHHKDDGFQVESRFEVDKGTAIADLAVTWPYFLVLSANRIRLIEMQAKPSATGHDILAVTLADLQSIARVSLTSLSIRKVSSVLIASIAYPFHRLNTGYCLGIQEIRISLIGEVITSRLTSTIDTPLKDFPLRKAPRVLSRATSTAPFPLHPQLMHPPNSLSHSGCYILAGLPDNTLMVYIVTSTVDKLEISAGRRLWGHTSSISGTEVSDRGKALSVSAKGEEIRIWELEDILSAYILHSPSTALKPRSNPDMLTSALAERGDGLGLATQELKHDLAWTRHWIGFDDEQVVVLGERDQKQILSCFTFT